jgi:hypothetical protein
MDKQRMTLAFDSLPLWAKLPDLLVHLAAGYAIGRLYFHSLWQSAHLFVDHAAAAIGWTVLRFGLLACALTLTAFEGALPLLVTALGIFLARPGLMGRAR